MVQRQGIEHGFWPAAELRTSWEHRQLFGHGKHL